MSGKNSPAWKEPEPVSSLGHADGRQPFMPASVSQPLPLRLIPLSFRPCEAVAAAFRRARDNAFIQRRDHHAAVLDTCKAITVVWLGMVNRNAPPAPIALAVRVDGP